MVQVQPGQLQHCIAPLFRRLSLGAWPASTQAPSRRVASLRTCTYYTCSSAMLATAWGQCVGEWAKVCLLDLYLACRSLRTDVGGVPLYPDNCTTRGQESPPFFFFVCWRPCGPNTRTAPHHNLQHPCTCCWNHIAHAALAGFWTSTARLLHLLPVLSVASLAAFLSCPFAAATILCCLLLRHFYIPQSSSTPSRRRHSHQPMHQTDAALSSLPAATAAQSVKAVKPHCTAGREAGLGKQTDGRGTNAIEFRRLWLPQPPPTTSPLLGVIN